MAFSEKDIDRLQELIKEVEGRKEHQYAAATLADRPALRELAEIADAHLANKTEFDEEDLGDGIVVYDYLGDRYDSMGRVMTAIDCYKKAFELSLIDIKKFGEDSEKALDLLYSLVHDRNIYVDDDCKDLEEQALAVIPKEEVKEVIEEALSRRIMLKRDPVEMTAEYLAVIDEIEEKIEQERELCGMGACLEVWILKQTYLAEKGIKWLSPFDLNPGVIFD